MATLEVINERTNKNTKELEKMHRCLFGTNGKGGGLMGEHEVVKNNLKWIKWLLSIQIPLLLGIIITIVTKLLA